MFLQIRSLTLDRWLPETVDVMMSLGNNIVNGMLEGKLSDPVSEIKKPNTDSTPTEKEAFLVAKYMKHQYLSLPEDNRIMQVCVPLLHNHPIVL
jgi:hypothetical protein